MEEDDPLHHSPKVCETSWEHRRMVGTAKDHTKPPAAPAMMAYWLLRDRERREWEVVVVVVVLLLLQLRLPPLPSCPPGRQTPI